MNGTIDPVAAEIRAHAEEPGAPLVVRNANKILLAYPGVEKKLIEMQAAIAAKDEYIKTLIKDNKGLRDSLRDRDDHFDTQTRKLRDAHEGTVRALRGKVADLNQYIDDFHTELDAKNSPRCEPCYESGAEGCDDCFGGWLVR